MTFPELNTRSAQLFERALRVMPGGNTRTSLYWPPYQLFAERGQGCFVVDVDGDERIDFHGAFSTLIHGHSHSAIVAAIQEQVSRLTVVGMSTETEIALAELLCERVSSFDEIRFANSGTEAVMNALKAGRGYRGRPRFAKCEVRSAKGPIMDHMRRWRSALPHRPTTGARHRHRHRFHSPSEHRRAL